MVGIGEHTGVAASEDGFQSEALFMHQRQGRGEHSYPSLYVATLGGWKSIQ